MKRKYDIGHGCIITDDGRVIGAEVVDGVSSTYIGITRPRVEPIPDELDAKFSVGGRYFYLKDFTDGRGFWLGTKAWDSKAEMEAQQMAGIFGKESVEITLNSGKVYFR